MATLHRHRLLIVAAAARTGAVNAWVKANIDPGGGDWLTTPLSPSGALPGTHYACSAGMTTTQARLMMRAICQALGMSPPEGSGWTRAQWKAWLSSVLAELRARGVSIHWADNDGAEWDDLRAAAAALSLKPCTSNL